MKCKICGSENIVEKDGQYVCESCGSVFFEAPTDDTPEMIKDAKDAIEAKEAEEKAEKEREIEKKEENQRLIKAEEARVAENALKNAQEEQKASKASNVKSIPLSSIANSNADSEEKETKPEVKLTVAKEKSSAENKAQDKPEKKAAKKDEPFYKPKKMADDFDDNLIDAVPPKRDEDEKKKKRKEKKKKKEEKAQAKAAAAEAKIQSESAEEEPKKKSRMREFLDFCLPIIIALIVAMLLKTCVFANAQVPTGSMLNTIQEGDRIIASRLEYKFHEPERYDIIIFKFPDDVAAHEKDKSVKVEYFVKRIIGLPGETVTIVNGVVYVTDEKGNTQQLRDDFVTACTPTGNFGPYKVPENSYFVLGDNRENSIDSRFWETTHYVDKSLIVGKVKFRYYPSIGKME